jgi:hypothetical protein
MESSTVRSTIDDVIQNEDQVLVRLGDPPSPIRAFRRALRSGLMW